MERLKKIGEIKSKSSSQIKKSKMGIGFEKLDRNAFDPEKAYDKLAKTGVKWVRIQSGWAKTETKKGIYDFQWLDKIVDNLLDRGLIPWMCLCYGNGLYDENAAKIFGAVGCPPIFTDEQKTAWDNYVKAVVMHFKDRVTHYEVWNEPDGIWCWKHGVNATELGSFTLRTAKNIKDIDSSLKVIGAAVCKRSVAYINEAFSTGMGEYLDFISFHEYTPDEKKVFERVKMLRSISHKYNPNIEIIQGESGSQSRSGGCGALHIGAWTETKQAKQLARHAIADLISDVYFTSYFSCLDMIEGLNGTVGDKSSHMDFGFFGVLGASFDEEGFASGEYTEKPSYYALQNISSVFAEDFDVAQMPVQFIPEESQRYFSKDVEYNDTINGSFKRENGEAFVYWYPSNIMNSCFEGTISIQIYSKYDRVRLLDVMDGSIYEIPKDIVSRDEFGTFFFKNLPLKDTPLILEFGNFCD